MSRRRKLSAVSTKFTQFMQNDHGKFQRKRRQSCGGHLSIYAILYESKKKFAIFYYKPVFSIKITSYVSFETPFIYLSLNNLTRISEERCFETWNVGELQRKYASYSRMDCVLGKVCRLGVRNSVCSRNSLALFFVCFPRQQFQGLSKSR